MGVRAGHRGLRHRARPPVGHGLRGRRRGPRGAGSTSVTSPRADRHPWRGRRRGRARELLVDARCRPRRALQRDLRRPWPGLRTPTAAPTSTRSGSWRSGTSCSCRTRSTASAPSSRRFRAATSTRVLARARGHRVAGRGRRFRDRPVPCRRSRWRSALSGKRHGADERDDISLKVIAEHGRATAFLIADGVLPSNEGRGYILRRMLRRVDRARAAAGDRARGPAAARCERGRGVRRRVPRAQGERGLHPAGRRLRGGAVRGDPSPGHGAVRARRVAGPSGGVVSGDDAFKLSDTFGFPVELTIELAADDGLQVDEDRFERCSRSSSGRAPAEPRRRSRSAWTPARCRRPSSSATSGPRPSRRSACCSTTTTPSSRSPKKVSRFGCSSPGRRSTPRAAARSATAA